MAWAREIEESVHGALASGQTPGAVILVARGERVLYHSAFGLRCARKPRSVMRPDAIFDLASLTKPLATATAIMQLVERRQLAVEESGSRWLPELPAEITIAQLLTHSAGLAPYADYLGAWGDRVPPADAWAPVVSDICRLPLQHSPGSQFQYSCLGYVLLRAIFEQTSGQTLAEWFAAEIAGPLGLADTGFLPSAEAVARCVPTADPRSDRPCGAVHDSIAYYVGGVGGNAGLFGTAADLSRFMAMLLNSGSRGGVQVLRPETVRLMTTPQLRLQDAERGFGWDIRSPYSAVVRGSFPVGSFGHTGYTGTSIWADPATGVHVIILTNRVHLGENCDIGPLRYRVASIVAANLIGPN